MYWADLFTDNNLHGFQDWLALETAAYTLDLQCHVCPTPDFDQLVGRGALNEQDCQIFKQENSHDKVAHRIALFCARDLVDSIGMKKILVVIGILIVVIVIWQVYPTEKKRLRRDINALEQAFENEDTAGLVGYIDPSYQEMGGLSYSEIIETIAQFFAQVDSIKVQMNGLQLSIDSVTEENIVFASCSLGLRVTARYEGERMLAFGGIIKPNPVKGYFRKSGKYYMVYRAEY
jgi:uncharacterized membrane protein YvbJ